MMKCSIPVLVAAACAIFMSDSISAQENFPNRTIRIVVGFTAGSPTDVPARFVAERLKSALGVSVIVENKTGAAGWIAMEDVLSKDPDGYNLFMCNFFDAINLALRSQDRYSIDDMTPISMLYESYQLVAVRGDFPATNLKDFIEYAKKHPGGLTYGHTGTGSSYNIYMKQFEKYAGISAVGVPYRGSPEMVQDLLTGRLDFGFVPTFLSMPHVSAGTIKALGAASPDRLVGAETIPTLTEQGIPFAMQGWLSICGPKGLPEKIIEVLKKPIAETVTSESYVKSLGAPGMMLRPSTPEEARRLIKNYYEDIRKIIQENNIKG